VMQNNKHSVFKFVRCVSLSSLAVIVFSSSFLSFSYSQSERTIPKVTIGVIYDGPMEQGYIIDQMVADELRKLVHGEYEIKIPKDKIIVADWTVKSIDAGIEKLLSDDTVDIVVSVGVMSSHQICLRKEYPKPVVASVVLHPGIQGIPKDGDSSGVNNLAYIIVGGRLEVNLKALKEIKPCKKIAILCNDGLSKVFPGFVKAINMHVSHLGYEVRVIEIGKNLDNIKGELEKGFDAVYVFPQHHLPNDMVKELISIINEAKLPSFADYDRTYVEWGLLMCVTPPSEQKRLSRKLALTIQRIVRGENPKTIPVEFTAGHKITINMATAEKINVWPSFGLMGKADLLNYEKDDEKTAGKFTLKEAVKRAIKTNLDILTRQRAVAAGQQNVYEAYTDWLPQANTSSEGRMVDRDRAGMAGGLNPQRAWTGTVGVNQLFFSENSLANITIQKRLQDSRVYNYDNLKLNIALSASVSYLNVLRAKTLEKVQKDNMKLTEKNLDVAKKRVDIGVASPGEVYRWENQFANDEKAVVDAVRDRNVAEVEFNRVLNLPLNNAYSIADTELEDPDVFPHYGEIYPYINNPQSIKVFIDFMVSEGVQTVPEIKRYTSLIKSQKRRLLSKKLDFILPDAAGFYDVTSNFGDAGRGRRSTELSKVDWIAGVKFTFPLFEGGAKITGYQRAKENLARLVYEKDSVVQKIDQSIRSDIFKAFATYQKIKLSYKARSASSKNLELVINAYSRGVVSILDLLDAQNAALVSDLTAANAVHDFLIDYMAVERSVGRFTFLESEKEYQEWRSRLEAYLGAAK